LTSTGSRSVAPLLALGDPRAVFAELVEGALDETGHRASPLATAYLIELLDERVRARPGTTRRPGGEPTLAEELLCARLESGATRVSRMHALGDRALFVAGFFGDSLCRAVVDLSYYREVGRAAYADLASVLTGPLASSEWVRLFEELADRFRDFVDVLAEVSDRAYASRPLGLLRLYDRYLQTGSSRDRRRLLRRGHVPPERRRRRLWQ
jgi:hypothetical protein